MFRRLNRRVVLTEAGKAYLSEIGLAFDRIALATSHHVARGRPRLLRVSATATLTLRWLIPRLSSFQLSNPSVEVRLTTSNEPIEVLALPEYRIPVCSRKLLARIVLPLVIARHRNEAAIPLERLTKEWLLR